MKTKSSGFPALRLKALLIITCTIFGFACFINCDAQSVVGKWRRTDTNRFTIDTTTGKQIPGSDEVKRQFDEHMASVGYKEILEFKPDHTYVSTISTNDNPNGTPHGNTWSLSGTVLDMNIPLVKNQKTSITIKSINAHTMVWDIIYMGSPNQLTEVTYTKI
jgi:hypothetical protein